MIGEKCKNAVFGQARNKYAYTTQDFVLLTALIHQMFLDKVGNEVRET